MFIESVRARATCNTIISSHPISSHRPCTNSSLLSPRVSSPFPSWFFFYSSSTRSLPPPHPYLLLLSFSHHQVCLFSSPQFDFFVLQSRLGFGSRIPPRICIFPLFFPLRLSFSSFLSIHGRHLASLTRVFVFLPYKPHRVSTILSPVVFTMSIQSYLILEEVSWNRHATVPHFLSSTSLERASFISGIEGKEIEIVYPESITSVISTWRCSLIFLFFLFFLLVVETS